MGRYRLSADYRCIPKHGPRWACTQRPTTVRFIM